MVGLMSVHIMWLWGILLMHVPWKRNWCSNSKAPKRVAFFCFFVWMMGCGKILTCDNPMKRNHCSRVALCVGVEVRLWIISCWPVAYAIWTYMSEFLGSMGFGDEYRWSSSYLDGLVWKNSSFVWNLAPIKLTVDILERKESTHIWRCGNLGGSTEDVFR